MSLRLLAILIFVICLPKYSYGWGIKGQQVTVKVAEEFLSQGMKTEIKKLTKGKPLYDLAGWADTIRGTPEWRMSGVWHYINVSELDNYYHEFVSSPEDIVDAIEFCSNQYKSSSSDKDKLTWLMFIIHLVGDLHQPLHSGKAEDRGGNQVQITYKKKMSLHALWDSGIIEKEGQSIDTYTQKLLSSGLSRDELSKKFEADAVVKENLKYRRFIYSFKNGTISEKYAADALKIIDERLWLGGLRLAALLNSLESRK